MFFVERREGADRGPRQQPEGSRQVPRQDVWRRHHGHQYPDRWGPEPGGADLELIFGGAGELVSWR